MPDAVEPSAIVRSFREHGTAPEEPVLSKLLHGFARPGQVEGKLVELKEQVVADQEAWCNLERQLVAFSNTEGGIIVFGLTADNRRAGLARTLCKEFDPVNITQKLQRHAPNAVIPTLYLELFQYNKRYGFLLIGRAGNIIVFDKPGNVPLLQDKSRQKSIFIPGIVYIRTEGASREARQSDIDHLLNDRLHEGLSAFLARIQRVAELPSNSELLARTPGSSRGYVLVSGGQGVPVTISEENTGVVQLAEVMTPEAPLSSLNAEVVGQLRQWHADHVHRVPRPTLMRWYLGRSKFTPMPERAEFCFLSALHDWGYPMYWASQVERGRLEELVRQQFEHKIYPDTRSLVYVIAAFFFSRRRQLISELAAYLPPEQTNVVKRLLDCPDARIYLTSGRLSGATKAWAGDKYLDLSQIMEERETTGKELFERLMQHHPNGNVPGEMRALAHQLDMMIHGDLNSLGRVAIYAPSAAAHSSSSTRTLYLTGRPAKCRLHLCPGPLRPTHRLRIRQAANSGLMRARSSIRVGLGLPLTWSGPWLARFDLHRRLA